MNPNQQFAPQQPVQAPQAPQASPVPPAPQQPMGGGQQPAPLQPQPPADSGKRKGLLIGLVAVVVLAVIAAAVFFFMSKRSGLSADLMVDDKPLATLSQKATLTESDVAAMDKTNAFWGYFKNAAQQTKLTITKEHSFADSPSGQPAFRWAKQTGFDYTSKKIVQAVNIVDPTDNTLVRYRCYDGKEFVLFSTSTRGWREKDSGDKFIYCKLGGEAADLNDGVNTGGLTAEQAEQMIQLIRKQDGLVSVDGLTLTEKQGKQYLKFDVTLHPIPAGKDTIYLGAQWLKRGFEQTGLDPTTHPYSYVGAGGNGLKIAYFVDPATKLPVYSEVGTTPLKDKSGTDIATSTYSFYKVKYTFGSLPDVTGTQVQDFRATW